MISDSLDDKGKGKIEAKAFSLKSNTKKILSIIDKANTQQNITRYAVLHANDPHKGTGVRAKVHSHTKDTAGIYYEHFNHSGD